jgi:hypothetical protein
MPATPEGPAECLPYFAHLVAAPQRNDEENRGERLNAAQHDRWD